MKKETIKLFKGIELKNNIYKNETNYGLLAETVRRGFIIDPRIVEETQDINSLITLIESLHGLTPEKMNQTLHKSWEKVENTPLEQLYYEQIAHYITTYGYEALGIYSEETVYIPNEKLDIPLMTGGVKLIVIRGMTTNQIKEKTFTLTNSGIALKEDTVKDVISILSVTGLTLEEFNAIKNKEVKVECARVFNYLPKEASEFLRYLLKEVADSTLLIKNKKTLTMIREAKKNKALFLTTAFSQYDKLYGLVPLAKSFKRYQSYYLAFKTPGNRTYINKLKKMSETRNVPFKADILNRITSDLRQGVEINYDELSKSLTKLNNYRKARLLKGLNYHLVGSTSIVYRVRNGKSYATTHEKIRTPEALKVIAMVEESLIEGIRKNVEGKQYYVPNYLRLELPTSEKQFVENIPEGSSIEVGEDMIVGVHWVNQHGRTDLDLKMMNVNGNIGWDASYRTEECLFSGDVTDAPSPKGATELFYIKNLKNDQLLRLNDFTGKASEKTPIEYKLLIASEKPQSFTRNYMVDPNKLIATIPMVIKSRQESIGLVKSVKGVSSFVFSAGSDGVNCTSRTSDVSTNVRNYLSASRNLQLNLIDYMKKAGAVFVEELSEEVVDLSIESLERDTIIKILEKQNE